MYVFVVSRDFLNVLVETSRKHLLKVTLRNSHFALLEDALLVPRWFGPLRLRLMKVSRCVGGGLHGASSTLAGLAAFHRPLTNRLLDEHLNRINRGPHDLLLARLAYGLRERPLVPPPRECVRCDVEARSDIQR